MSRESHRVSTTGLYSKSSTGMVVSLVTAQEGLAPIFSLSLMTSGIPQASLTFRSNITDADSSWTIFTRLVSSGVTWMVEDVRLVEV